MFLNFLASYAGTQEVPDGEGGTYTQYIYDDVWTSFAKDKLSVLFLYLAILYGFLEWQVPEKILLLPAVPDALKIFEGDFLSVFDERLAAEASGESTDAETEAENL